MEMLRALLITLSFSKVDLVQIGWNYWNYLMQKYKGVWYENIGIEQILLLKRTDFNKAYKYVCILHNDNINNKNKQSIKNIF